MLFIQDKESKIAFLQKAIDMVCKYDILTMMLFVNWIPTYNNSR